MARPNRTHIPLGVVAALIPAFGVVGVFVSSAFRVVEDVATKPYVNVRVEEATASAKAREQAILEKAIEHSDHNHEDMVLRLQQQSTDIKTQGAKIDILLDYERARQPRR